MSLKPLEGLIKYKRTKIKIRSIIVNYLQKTVAFQQERMFSPLWMQAIYSTGAYLNGTVCECIIEMCNPPAAGELSVMERAGLHHSLHRRRDESRVREADRDVEAEREEGAGETPY